MNPCGPPRRSTIAGDLTPGFVGSGSTNAPDVPLIGWARDRGDLRVAHLHFIPAFGFLAALALPTTVAYRAVIGFSAVFTAFVCYTFGEALMGHPFFAVSL